MVRMGAVVLVLAVGMSVFRIHKSWWLTALVFLVVCVVGWWRCRRSCMGRDVGGRDDDDDDDGKRRFETRRVSYRFKNLRLIAPKAGKNDRVDDGEATRRSK